jgi:hypothetical protein
VTGLQAFSFSSCSFALLSNGSKGLSAPNPQAKGQIPLKNCHIRGTREAKTNSYESTFNIVLTDEGGERTCRKVGTLK